MTKIRRAFDKLIHIGLLTCLPKKPGAALKKLSQEERDLIKELKSDMIQDRIK